MLDIQKIIGFPKIVTSKVDDYTTRFEVRYLPRGFGHTLGNSLRRLLLAYNVSGAITGMKIEGVTHEFYVIDGVKESVLDIMLNFKQLRFNILEDDTREIWVNVKFKGVKKYTSEDLKLPSNVELLSEGDYLFEITDPSVELNIDLRIERGYGYYSLEFLNDREEKKEDKDVNLLLIDNEFKVVDYVRYWVEDVIDDYVGGTKDLLVLEIKSKYKKVTPQQLLSFAGEVLARYAKLFVFDESYIDESVLIDKEDLIVEGEDKSDSQKNLKTMPIDALPLSERTRNALIKNGILYVEELEKKKKGELLLMKGIGRKAIDEINKALANINKSLAG